MKVKVATLLACDFCGKDENEVKKLIKGPKDVCICDECVDVCIRVLDEKAADPTPTGGNA
jgi:ATP-dependent Clp protease ATP-binding subunit ClpX